MIIVNRPDAILVHVPAKINPYLRVVGVRKDGFHELETVMATVGLYDTLLFQRRVEPGWSLICHVSSDALPWQTQQNGEFGVTREDAPIGESARLDVTGGLPGDVSQNLVWRAAEQLAQAAAAAHQGARITLLKRIPWQSGLGGGSADAAATLVGLNRLWGLGLTESRLHELAASLGSDVNFFLADSPWAWCSGRGEHVFPVASPPPAGWVVLARPTMGLATAEVFQTWDAIHQELTPAEVTEGRWTGNLNDDWPLHNDLTAAACRLQPAVTSMLELLRRECGAAAGLSGSGTACFARVRHRSVAQRAARRMRAAHQIWAKAVRCGVM